MAGGTARTATEAHVAIAVPLPLSKKATVPPGGLELDVPPRFATMLTLVLTVGVGAVGEETVTVVDACVIEYGTEALVAVEKFASPE